MGGLEIAEIAASVYDSRDFYAAFNGTEENDVRRYNAAGYVKSVRGISRPGTRLLLLAGSAKEERRAGPPKIKEEEIRGDFSEQFTFEWLRDIRFDSANPDANGFKAWSVLLRCKE